MPQWLRPWTDLRSFRFQSDTNPARFARLLLLGTVDNPSRAGTSYAPAAEALMPESTTLDRRATRRFLVDLPISYRRPNNSADVNSHTRDISSRGVSFYSGMPLPEGASIQFMLTLPAELTRTESIKMRCWGHVLRVEFRQPKRPLSVVAVIDRYEFLGDR